MSIIPAPDLSEGQRGHDSAPSSSPSPEAVHAPLMPRRRRQPAPREEEVRETEREKEVESPVQTARRNLYSLLGSNRTDIMLLGGYNSIIIFLDGGSDPAEPTGCTVGQHICSWLAFALIVAIYFFRHNYELLRQRKRARHRAKKLAELMDTLSERVGPMIGAKPPKPGHMYEIAEEDRPLWFQLGRTLIFAVFLLCLHVEPIVCGLEKGDLKALKFVQATLLIIMAIAAGAALTVLDRGRETGAGTIPEARVESDGPPPLWATSSVRRSETAL